MLFSLFVFHVQLTMVVSFVLVGQVFLQTIEILLSGIFPIVNTEFTHLTICYSIHS